MSESNRSTVELVELYADGLVKKEVLSAEEERCRMYQDLEEEDIQPEDRPLEYWCAYAACKLTEMHKAATDDVLDAVRWATRNRKGELEDHPQARMVRDVIGNPFRATSFDSRWQTSTVTKMAAAIYEERQLPSGLFDNKRMGVLADALEEAGCNNAGILGHLRNGGEHVRGCWAIDLLLGRE